MRIFKKPRASTRFAWFAGKERFTDDELRDPWQASLKKVRQMPI